MGLELDFLLLTTVIGVVVGLAFLIPTILWRFIRKKPLFKKDKKLESPKVFYAGIAFFGGFAIFSFLTGTPLFAFVFLLFMLLGIRALIVYKRSK